jgi:ABC-type multidrug transport system fused ATPase/permease subunit
MPMEPYFSSYALESSFRNIHKPTAWTASPNFPDAHQHPLFYVGVFAAIGFATVAVGILAAAAQYTGALRASRILFKQLLVGVVRATMRWHDVTPQGRMLNRFSKVRIWYTSIEQRLTFC